MMGRILTAEKAAEILNIPTDDVLGMVADGELSSLYVNESTDEVLIAEASLREFLAASWVGDPWEGLR